MQLIAPLPFEEAVSKFGALSPVSSVLKSADWRNVPVALRERAFFSATVESARFLQSGQSEINDFLTGARATNERGESYLKSGGRAQFIERMQQFAIRSGMGPLDPNDKGTLKDIRSEGRLALVYDTNVKAAQDFGYWKQGQDPDVLDAFPAQRFIRVRLVKKPRAYHRAHEGEVHRKDDLTFWLAMNPDFRVPWGPWGFHSGMDVEDVGRREAESIGLVKADEDFTHPAGGKSKPEADFNQHLQASTQGLNPKLVHFLKLAFEDQVEIKGDVAVWKPGRKTLPGEPSGSNSKRNEPGDSTPQRDSPEAAAHDLKEILAAGGARPPFGFGAQQRALEEWARAGDRWLEWDTITAGAKPGGIEHLVKPEPGKGEVIKITIPPVFGRFPGLTRDGQVRLFDATPLQYLERSRLQNEWFNDEISVLGAAAQKAGQPSIVTTQPYIKGSTPTQEQLIQDLATFGFQKAPGEWLFYNRQTRQAIFDARPANFVWARGRAVPIDAIPCVVSEAMHRALLKLFVVR